MKSCLAEENYEAAAEIADSINWNKINEESQQSVVDVICDKFLEIYKKIAE